MINGTTNGKSTVAILTLGATVIAGSVGYGLGVGSWQGKAEQMLAQHDAQLIRHEIRIDANNTALALVREQLVTVQTQLGFILTAVNDVRDRNGSGPAEARGE